MKDFGGRLIDSGTRSAGVGDRRTTTRTIAVGGTGTTSTKLGRPAALPAAQALEQQMQPRFGDAGASGRPTARCKEAGVTGGASSVEST